MKKIIVLITLGLCLFALPQVQAQTAIGRGNSIVLDGSQYGYLWGTTADSLYASTTLQATIRIKASKLQNVYMSLYATKISGTVTANFITQGSMDNATFVNVDTIVVSNVSTGMVADYAKLSNWNYPYLRIKAVADATAQRSWFKLWFVKRDQ
jgi:hypothetical protein